jgi:hypothetical protein
MVDLNEPILIKFCFKFGEVNEMLKTEESTGLCLCFLMICGELLAGHHFTGCTERVRRAFVELSVRCHVGY